jgi:thymidylate synthase (FAD)
MTTKIVHAGDESHILYIARVSSNQENTDPKLLQYLIRQNHWSPFEMVGACVEINTTRDIGRQILRHRSFSFQEFSQRYAAVGAVLETREIRFKGDTNRQGSKIPEGFEQEDIAESFRQEIVNLAKETSALYQQMIDYGVAPECARAVLPEGLTPTRLYMNGTLRSWIHYLRERCKLQQPVGYTVRPYAQLEHYRLAREIEAQLREAFPVTFAAVDLIGYIDQVES